MVPKNVTLSLDVEELRAWDKLKLAIEAKTGMSKISGIAAFRYMLKFTLDNINKKH